MLAVKDLHSGYGDVQVLNGISMTLNDREALALVGANGAGKTTFLKTITGLIPTKSGSVLFQGELITGLTANQIVERGLVMVPENRSLFPFMTVLENLELGSYSKRSRGYRKQSLQKVFDLMPRLAERRNQVAGSLSGGEQQMCAIGRGLMARPELLLLDEPSIGLAPIIAQEVFRLLVSLRSDGIPILLVEQHVKHALNFADSGIVLQNGRISISGPSKNLMNDKSVQKAFLGGR